MNQADQIEADTGTAAAAPSAGPAGRSPSLEELKKQHRELDEALQELTRYGHLSPLQQHEAAVMKKRKLALKDRIAALAASS